MGAISILSTCFARRVRAGSHGLQAASEIAAPLPPSLLRSYGGRVGGASGRGRRSGEGNSDRIAGWTGWTGGAGALAGKLPVAPGGTSGLGFRVWRREGLVRVLAGRGWEKLSLGVSRGRGECLSVFHGDAGECLSVFRGDAGEGIISQCFAGRETLGEAAHLQTSVRPGDAAHFGKCATWRGGTLGG